MHLQETELLHLLELWGQGGFPGEWGREEKGQGPVGHTHQSGTSVEPIMEAMLITGFRATQAPYISGY